MQLGSDLVDRLLDSWPVARLGSVADGPRPHLVPVAFARLAGRIWSPVDGKPKAGRELARLRHVRAQPRVCLLLDHYAEDWTQLWWVRVEGTARIVMPPDAELEDAGPVVAALRAKYPQYLEVPVLRDPPTLLAIEPSRTLSWCASSRARNAVATRVARQRVGEARGMR